MGFWKTIVMSFVKAKAPVAPPEIFTVVVKGDHDRLRALLQKGISPNTRDKFKRTPLHEVISESNAGGISRSSRETALQTAMILLEHGADVNARTSLGETPLHEAANIGYCEMVELLLRHGASREARTREGSLPLDSAIFTCFLSEHLFSERLLTLLATPAILPQCLTAFIDSFPVWIKRNVNAFRRGQFSENAYVDDYELVINRCEKIRQVLERAAGLPAIRQDSPTLVSTPRSDTITHIIIFKTGARPADETAYLKHVLEAIGLLMNDVRCRVDFVYVDSSNLTPMYTLGYMMELGHDANKCTRTPFVDRDGGKGLVVRVYGPKG
jgi:hypothetical protein